MLELHIKMLSSLIFGTYTLNASSFTKVKFLLIARHYF